MKTFLRRKLLGIASATAALKDSSKRQTDSQPCLSFLVFCYSPSLSDLTIFGFGSQKRGQINMLQDQKASNSSKIIVEQGKLKEETKKGSKQILPEFSSLLLLSGTEAQEELGFCACFSKACSFGYASLAGTLRFAGLSGIPRKKKPYTTLLE